MFWVNGQPAERLPLTDRSIHYGDGCFTTARVLAGSVLLLEQHLQRLQNNAAALYISDIPWPLLREEIAQVARQAGEGVVKVILTRGSSGRGYAIDPTTVPNRIISVASYPQYYPLWREQGISLQLSPVRLGINPHLAGIKHLNRLEQVLIRHSLSEDVQDAVVMDSEGMLVECCAANLFWRKQETIYTPLLDRAGVKGIMRQHIINQLSQLSLPVQEVRAPVDVLASADEVWICNSLMPLLPVRQIATWRYDNHQLFDTLLPLCCQV
ncbi:MAG: aminodeoxychorismate lyase [Enterobacteriaceae bacterium]